MENQQNNQTVNNQGQQSLIKPGRQVVVVEGQLKKIIHEQGSGQCPQKGQEVFALYRGTLQTGQQFDSNQDREDPFKFTLGQGMVIKGWDEGFASMKKGEKATLICSPDYAYGKRGSPPKIPGNSTLNFEVELLDFQSKKKQKFELSDEEKVSEATNFKNQGNEAFKKGQYKQAVRLYKDGLEYVDSQQSAQAQQIEKILRLNAAQSQIKIGQYEQAEKNCTKVLQKDSNNAKALYRRGVSYLKSQQFEKATSDFQLLLKIDENNVQAKKQLQNVKTAERAYKQKQKKVFGNMFGKPDEKEQIKKQKIPKVEQNKN